MKNPFEKNDHKVLIAGILIGTVVAGATAYLFLTETGTEVRGQLAGHFGRLRETFLGGGEPQEEQPEPPQQAAKKPKAAPHAQPPADQNE